jgi:hypothetical protein
VTTPRIDELRRLEAAATPGPWYVNDDYRGSQRRELDGDRSLMSRATTCTVNAWRLSDAALFAAARNALPLLLDVVEAAQEEELCAPSLRYGAKAKKLRALAALEADKEETWTEYHEFRKRTDPPPWGQGKDDEEPPYVEADKGEAPPT